MGAGSAPQPSDNPSNDGAHEPVSGPNRHGRTLEVVRKAGPKQNARRSARLAHPRRLRSLADEVSASDEARRNGGRNEPGDSRRRGRGGASARVKRQAPAGAGARTAAEVSGVAAVVDGVVTATAVATKPSRPRGTGSVQWKPNGHGRTYYAVVRVDGKPKWLRAGPTRED